VAPSTSVRTAGSGKTLSKPSMAYTAVVEISLSAGPDPDPDPQPSVGGRSLSVLRAAYEASARGVVLLLIPDGAQRAIDRALDSLVAQNRRVRGLVYRETSNPALMEGVAPDTLVIAETPRVRAAARAVARECLSRGAGLAVLESWAAGHRKFDSAAAPASLASAPKAARYADLTSGMASPALR
jgi:hypothetical protein